MLKLGEKGVIPQRDGQTYAVAPHIPCGLITPELLRRLADVAERYHAQAVKITGATRVAIIGLREEDIDRVWEDLRLDKGAAVEKVIAVYAKDAKKGERLGKMIDRLGIEPFKAALA